MSLHPLLITALYPPAVGGAATYFGTIVPELVQDSHIERLTVLTEHMPGQPRRSSAGKLRTLRLLPTRLSLTQHRWLGHALTFLLTELWFATRLPGLVHRHTIDLVHFHTRYRGRVFHATLQRCGVPVVADLRDKMTNPVRLLSVADLLLCCGEGVQRFAIEGGFPRQRTVLIPVPFTPPEPPSSVRVSETRHSYGLGDDPYLLFLGDITYNKGVFDLLQAYRLWQPDHPQVQLVFAGVNREQDRFLTQMRQTAGTIYLGQVSQEDAWALIRDAEIVVLPSRSEGLPRVILEAVSLGTKVICPPGIPEFEQYLPHYVLHKVQPDYIASALDTVWHDRDLPSYPFAKHSLKRMIQALVDVYGEAVETARSGE